MKIFAISDIHSFMLPMITALNEKGFEPNNPEHLLVVCGDLFDRGPDTIKLIEYINNLTNVVLVRGNHEDLMVQMVYRGYAETHDVSNGTLRTANDILLAYENEVDERSSFNPFKTVRDHLWPIFNRMVNYFETKNYVFVHGWIPLKCEDDLPAYYQNKRKLSFDPDWRHGNWDQARWLNGMRMANNGFIIPDKTIVCGHWHCSYGHMMDSISTAVWRTEFEEDAIWEPYYANGIIAIDRCTAYTNECNVIVLEDDLLEDNK
ncbi:MAG: metallophosphoesterase [Lachnospiraceae bacterium]|nr:metallophosphoesterase [Lachnospiraceae bacterium]